MTISAKQLASAIEHTLLKPEATTDAIDALCDEAVAHRFHGVCVNPIHVRRATDRIASAGSAVRVVAVIGFPLGATLTANKVDEARRAMDDGAFEIDMVANIGALMALDRQAVRNDVEAVARAVHGGAKSGVLKVILETAVLSDEGKILGCRCSAEGEADFVKTSTGLHSAGGATAADVALLYKNASPLGVKAAGGIRTVSDAAKMLEVGATRLGTSAGVMILRGLSGAAS
jgi:deoxyribose-phosphate aldolase